MIEIRKYQQSTMTSRLPFYLKCGAILLLLSLSFLLIACGASDTGNTAGLNNPPVTVTIRFTNNLSSLGTVSPYLCGAWTHDTTPGFNPGSQIPIYAHFVHNVNGNPVGVNGASAQASVQWADGSRANQAGTTTGDGLVVFYFTIPNRPDMVGKNNLVTVSFTAPNGQVCNIDNQSQPAAFFTLIEVSPTPTAAPSVTPTGQSIRDLIPSDLTPPDFLPSDGRKNQAASTPKSTSGFPSGF
jgi:hypothetical protein